MKYLPSIILAFSSSFLCAKLRKQGNEKKERECGKVPGRECGLLPYDIETFVFDVFGIIQILGSSENSQFQRVIMDNGTRIVEKKGSSFPQKEDYDFWDNFWDFFGKMEAPYAKETL